MTGPSSASRTSCCSTRCWTTPAPPPSSRAITDPHTWNRANNEIAWRSYLGDAYGTDQVSPYASPTRMQDLSGLPPTTVLTGELDLFRDEDIHYAHRLLQAGVPTDLHVYAGAHHGCDRMVPDAQVTPVHRRPGRRPAARLHLRLRQTPTGGGFALGTGRVGR